MIRMSWMMGFLLLAGTGCVVPSLEELLGPEQQAPDAGCAASASIQVFPDVDGDGYGAAGAVAQSVCGAVPAGYSKVAEDCDDRFGIGARAHPGGVEVCDQTDNDCDGQVDEGLPLTDFYPDRDGDGVGAGVALKACAPPLAHAARSGDCDDDDPERSPSQFERLDGKDNNCSGAVDEALFSAREYHAVSMRPDGTLLAWGDGEWGALGDGTTTSHDLPARVRNLTGVIAVAAGTFHTVALRQDGSVWTWGSNQWGQLGLDESSVMELVPRQVQSLTEMTAVSSGLAHSVALKKDGTVWAWGFNATGELGDGSTDHRPLPVKVQNLSDVVAAVAGSIHSVALKRDGSVWAWGFNENGQLGDGTTLNRLLPVRVKGLTDIAAIASHGDHSVALQRDGTLWVWGKNELGQLGDGTTTARTLPVKVSIPGGVASVLGGFNHTVALSRDGTVWSWGSNGGGQLGNGSTRDSPVPVRAQGLADVVSVSAAFAQTFAVRRDGTVWAWGSNAWGLIGDGTKVDRVVPVRVPVLDYPMDNFESGGP